MRVAKYFQISPKEISEKWEWEEFKKAQSFIACEEDYNLARYGLEEKLREKR